MAHSQAVELPLNTAPAPPTHPPTSVTVPEQGTGAGPASGCPAGPERHRERRKAGPPAPVPPPCRLEGRTCRRPPGFRPAFPRGHHSSHPSSFCRSGPAWGGGQTTGSRQAPSRGLAPSGELPRASPERGQQGAQDTPGQRSGCSPRQVQCQTSQGRHLSARPGEDTPAHGVGQPGHATQREAGPHLPPSGA